MCCSTHSTPPALCISILCSHCSSWTSTLTSTTSMQHFSVYSGDTKTGNQEYFTFPIFCAKLFRYSIFVSVLHSTKRFLVSLIFVYNFRAFGNPYYFTFLIFCVTFFVLVYFSWLYTQRYIFLCISCLIFILLETPKIF